MCFVANLSDACVMMSISVNVTQMWIVIHNSANLSDGARMACTNSSTGYPNIVKNIVQHWGRNKVCTQMRFWLKTKSSVAVVVATALVVAVVCGSCAVVDCYKVLLSATDGRSDLCITWVVVSLFLSPSLSIYLSITSISICLRPGSYCFSCWCQCCCYCLFCCLFRRWCAATYCCW